LKVWKEQISNVAGLELVEPAREEDVSYLWGHMRDEERGEAMDAGGSEELHRTAILGAERSISVFHRGVLLAIATTFTLPSGETGLSMERTVHALEPGHRFTWLRAYGRLAEWIGPCYTLTPTNLPRALDVYRHAGATVVGTTTVGGREYWVLKIGG